MIFPYGARETEYLSRRDPALGAWIDRIGHVSRACIPDLFAALVNAIAAQQVSTRAYETVWARILARGLDRPENALEGSMDGIGLGPRKEKWIRSIAQRALDGTLEKEAF